MRGNTALLRSLVVPVAPSWPVLGRGRSYVVSFRVKQLGCLNSLQGNLGPLFMRQKQQFVRCPLVFSLKGHSYVSSSHGSQGDKARKDLNKNMHDEVDEDFIIKKCKWDSPEFPERLGFAVDEQFDENQLRRNYRILVKRFHPDSPTAPPQHATEAFQRIKEAYDALSHTIKDNTNGEKFASGTYHNPGGMTFSDEERRRAQMRVLGDGIILFLLMTLFYIFLVSRHNAKRLRSYYLWHFVGIFFTIQLFPRLLAAAVLFAYHTTYLIANAELKEQNDVTVLLHQDAHDMRMQLQGIPSKDAANVVIQVVVSAPKDITASRAMSCAKNETEHPSRDGQTFLHSTTLTFDKGVLDVVMPLPPKGLDQKTTYSVKAVDQTRKFVFVDKTFSLKA